MKRLFGFALVLALCLGLFAANVYAGGEDTVTVDPVVVDGEVIDVSTSAPVTMSAALDDEGFVALKNGNYEDWIDRLDLTDVAYASDLYDWLVKQLNMKGTSALSTPEYVYNESIDNEYNQKYYGVTLLGTGNYAHPITSFNGSLTVYYAEGADDAETEANMKAAVSQAVAAAVESQVDTVSAHAAAVYYAFNRDQMWAFWLSGQMQCGYSYGYSYSASGGVAQVSYTNNIYFYLLTPSFDIRAEGYRENAEDGYNDAVALDVTTLENSVDYITYNIPDDADTYDKVELFHDWLTKNNHYNLSDDLNAIDHHCRTAFGAIGGYDPVCEGYARAFKMLCDWQNIPCVLVDGTVNGGGHMWNYVQMDDGKWYAVDVTWDDPVVSGITSDLSGYERHDYFLVGADTIIDGVSFISSHPVSNKPSESAPAFTNGPILNSTQYGIIASGDCGDDLTWSLSSDGVLTISGTGEMWDFNCSSDSRTNDAPWVEYKSSIKHVVINEGVTSIGEDAFFNYTTIQSISIPKSLKSSAFGAFYQSIGLGKVYISDINAWCNISFTSTGNPLHMGAALYLCGEKLTELTIPAEIGKIGDFVFYGCTSITDVKIAAGIDSIGRYAFTDCENLVNVSIPDSVTNIGEYAFWNCSSLSNVNIPSGLTSISEGAFCGAALTKLEIPNGVVTVGKSAFGGNASLKSVTLPNTLESIGKSAFSGCKVESIVIPKSVKEIGENAFYNCKSLKEIDIPEGVSSVGAGAFSYCSALQSANIPSTVKMIADHLFYACTALTTVNIAEGVETIEYFAFGACKSLERFVIPASVTKLGSCLFLSVEGAFSIPEVVFMGDYPSIDEYAFDGVITTCYYYPNCSGWLDYRLRDYSGDLTWVAAETHPTYKALTSNSSGQLLVDGELAPTNIGGYFLLESGYYYLANDVKLKNEIYIGSNKTVTICLDSHVLQYIGTDFHSVINVGESGSLTLVDCGNLTHKFSVSDSGLWVMDETNGTKTVTGGVITGGKASNGGAITVNGGCVYQYSCNLVGNNGECAGAVHVSRGVYYMDGGKILGNISNQAGGILCSGSDTTVVDIKNADISHNYSDSTSGAIHIHGKNVTVSDSTISCNYGYNTGGITVVEGAKLVLGGNCVVTGNVSEVSSAYIKSAGGIKLIGSMEVSGKLIVDDNYCNDVEENIRVWSDGTFVIGESFSSESSIGITAGGDVPCVITSNGGAAYASCFTSDDDAYRIITDSGEVVIEKAGYTISGEVTSWNGNNKVVIELYAAGTAGEEDAKVLYSVEIDPDNKVGQTTQSFTLEGVAAGTYDLVVKKAAHLDYTIRGVVVEGNLDLTENSDTRISQINMIAGDVDGNGVVDGIDLSLVWSSDNYNKAEADANNKLTDINGDHVIEGIDLSIVWSSDNYNKGISNCDVPYTA